MDTKQNPISEALSALSQERESDVFLLSGAMDFETQDLVKQAISKPLPHRKSVTLVLCTPGGSADVAYRISRAFQRHYEHVTCIVGGWCKSAGTLCAIGAHELVMCEDAELGPLDVQISKRDEIDERDSGLDVSEALQSLQDQAFQVFESFMLSIKNRSSGAITFKMASDVAATLTVGLLDPVYRQIDPVKLGANQRSLSIALAYGKRLNVKSKNLKSDALLNLTIGYPSHGFVIDAEEAKELFNRVRSPTAAEVTLVRAFGLPATMPSQNPLVYFLNPKDPTHEIPANPKASTTESPSDDDAAPSATAAKPQRRERSAKHSSVGAQ